MFKLFKVASAIILAAKTKTHLDPLRTRDKGVCKWGALRPQPPALF